MMTMDYGLWNPIDMILLVFDFPHVCCGTFYGEEIIGYNWVARLSLLPLLLVVQRGACRLRDESKTLMASSANNNNKRRREDDHGVFQVSS